MIATISSKGQVTIPVEARRRLGLHEGSHVDFLLTDNDRLEVIPVSNSIKQLKGMVPAPSKKLTLDEMDKAIAKGLQK